MDIAQRLQILRLHLYPRGEVSPTDGSQEQLEATPCSAASHSLPRFDPAVMSRYLESNPLKNEVYEIVRKHPELLPEVTEGMRKEEHRELVRKCLYALLSSGYSPLDFFDRDYKSYFLMAETLSVVDLSLTVKMGVQYSLWGGSVLNLGTERHRKQYFADIDQFRLPGCFAMTELGHGSNVAALQTEAVFDPVTDEFVINTPDDNALKWWIGNAAEDGQMTTVFARLKVPASGGSQELADHGVHAFIVPLRDGPGPGNTVPGVEIRDCGYKVGLQGVDNGAIRFSNVRIPRGNLLDRFGQVDRAGNYTSTYSMNRRFAATLGELTGGRVGLTCGSLGILKGAVTIAIRYSATRQQFGPAGSPEISVLDYKSQQEKLIPMLASAYALHFTSRYLVQQYCEMKRTKEDEIIAEVHSLSAGLKAYTTNYTQNALSVCRECCGGHGYAAVNRMGAWRSDHDIFQTFEGDNTVLLQQVAGLLLKRYKDRFTKAPVRATYSYMRDWAADKLPANPLASHETDARHLRDPAFLRAALRHRTHRLLYTVAQRLNKHAPRLGGFQAWNKCLSHLLALSRAHIEMVIWERFQAAVDACPDAASKKVLKALADIFALKRIHDDILFRNDEFVGADKSKAIQHLLESLYREVRGVALPLVDAFDIPDFILRAPIGMSTLVTNPYADYLHSIGWE